VSGSRHRGTTILDAHVHVWDPMRFTYSWLDPVPALCRAFRPEHLDKQCSSAIEVILVEAGRLPVQALDEVAWMRRLARASPWIRGVVAHADLDNTPTAAWQLSRYAQDPFVVGVRRNLQDERAAFTFDADFRTGVRLLGAAALPFDACVRSHQLAELDELAVACPQTYIVLDHLGKPSHGGAGTRDSAWRDAIRRLARRPNVVCKLSGLTTEAPPGTRAQRLLPYLREALDAFGPERCLYGSDWPVMTLAADYRTWLDLVLDALAEYSTAHVDAVLHDNAARIYRLGPKTFPDDVPGKGTA
jgi:L-fuconolactonase